MHIAHINTNIEWGGGESQVLSLVAGLSDRAIRTTLFAYPDGKLFERAGEKGLSVEVIPGRYPAIMAPLSSLHMRRSMRGRDIDLVHVHDSKAISVGAAAARRLNIPVVLSRRIASPLRRSLLSKKKYSRRNLSAVIAVSETVKNVFIRSGYPADCIHVVPSALDVEALNMIEKDQELRRPYGNSYVVVGVGKLSLKKNWKLMIEVAARLAIDGPDIQWVLVGEGPERHRLERLAQELGVSDRVHFLGFRFDATRIIKSMDILFFPSLMEGAPGAIREAMVLGVPVVAVDAPGSVELLADCGWIVKADDVEQAGKSVMKALLDERLRKDMSERAHKSAVRRFSMVQMIDRTISVYENVLSRHIAERKNLSNRD